MTIFKKGEKMKKHQFWISASIAFVLINITTMPLALSDTSGSSSIIATNNPEALTDNNQINPSISLSSKEQAVTKKESNSEENKTTVSSEEKKSKELSATTEKKSGIVENKTKASSTIGTSTGNWGTATYEFDSNTGTVTVHDGILQEVTDREKRDTPFGLNKSLIKSIIFGNNVSLPTNASDLFYDYISLASISGNVDTSKVADMSGMFIRTGFTSLNFSNWDTSKVTNMSGMFSLTSITSLDISNWDTSKVTNMSGMFTFVETLSSLKLGSKSILNENAGLVSPGYDSSTMSLGTNYTGRWINLETGNAYSSSNDLLKNYNGTAPGTYTWEKGQNLILGKAQVMVKNSIIYVGDNWKPSDNFMSALNRDGNAINLDKLSIKGTVDTTKAGKYDVTYILEVLDKEGMSIGRQVSSTAYITVLDKSSENIGKSVTPTPTVTSGANNSTTTSRLPKTGDVSSISEWMIGLSFLTLASLLTVFGFSRGKKRK